MRVMVVDGDLEFLAVLDRSFQEHGFEMMPARSRQEAVATLGNDPQLVLLSHELGEEDGGSVGRALREHGYDGPIVGVSGSATNQALTDFASIGVVKVVDRATLGARPLF